ncbi:hypothetical protein [Methanofollis formosanus]|nr:hypothetical protein [Methanofollis formosanus]
MGADHDGQVALPLLHTDDIPGRDQVSRRHPGRAWLQRDGESVTLHAPDY